MVFYPINNMKQRIITLVLVLASVAASIAQPSLSNTSKWSVYDGNNNWITTGALFKQYCLGVSDLSVWTGSTSITTLGTIGTGTWNGTNIALNKIAQGGATSGQVLEWNGSAWAPATDDTGGGGVSGTDAQTIRFNGTTQEASSQITNNGSAVGIGGSPSGAYELKVYGAQESTGSYQSTGSGNVASALAAAATRWLNTSSSLTWSQGQGDNGNLVTYVENLPTGYVRGDNLESFDLYPKTVGGYNRTISTAKITAVDSTATAAEIVSEHKLNGDAAFRAKVAGTGDPKTTWATASQNWSMGIDNSVTNDPLVISPSQTVGASPAKTFDAATSIETANYAPVETRTTTLSGSATLTNSDYIVICTGASNFTVTLPSTITVGKKFFITNTGTGTITISVGSNFIQGTGINSVTLSPSNNFYIGSMCIRGISSTQWVVDHQEVVDRSVNLNDFSIQGVTKGQSFMYSGSAWNLEHTEQKKVLSAQVTNATTSFADVGTLSWDVLTNEVWEFEAVILYNVNAATTGTNWAINGPAGDAAYTVLTSTSATAVDYRAKNALDASATSNATAYTARNIAIIKGIVRPVANGTYVLRFAAEVAIANAVTADYGSVLKFRRLI